MAGPADDVAALQTALTDPFQRLGVVLQFERRRGIDPVKVGAMAAGASSAELSFDLSRANAATLFLTDGARVYVRTFDLSRGFDEVAIELLVVAARSSVQAILAGAPIGVQRNEYERSVARPSTASIPPQTTAARKAPASIGSRRRLLLASDYELGLLESTTVTHGPGLGLWWSVGQLALRGGVRGRLPLRFASEQVGVDLTAVSARVAAAFEQPVAAQWQVLAGLGAGLDAVRVRPKRLQSNDATLSRTGWTYDPLIQTLGGVAHTWNRLRLGLFLGADVALVRARYTIDRAGQREALFVPWTVRPWASLELSIALSP